MKIFLFLFFLIPTLVFSNPPKRELRAAWIATVFNIDWPSQKGLPPEQQKKELIHILDTLQDLKMNAAILQVKPTSDAFYPSKLSPWSYYLTGTQGKNPGYDPLAFFIQEAKKRSIETHVWVNPFRVLNGEGLDTLHPKHIALKNPNWVIEYNKRYYFDPGNPKTREYVIDSILEIVENYDIDALHMDDYFFPYKSSSNGVIIPFNDDTSWGKYKTSFKSREDWRRDSVNSFVQDLSQAIKKTKSYVQFGISPFGVWRNKSVDPRGSDTTAGQTNYDDLYADVLLWIDNGWIDYVLPQIYWHFDTKGVPYDVLVQWWNNAVKDKVNLMIGIGLYKLGEQNWPLTHIKEQINYERKQKYSVGTALYSAKWITKDTKGILGYIQKEIYPYYALAPENPHIASIKPLQPLNVTLKTGRETKIRWDNQDPEHTRYFVLYRFSKETKPDPTNPKNIMGIVSAQNPLEFVLPDHDDKYTYGITSVSRLHKESTFIYFSES